jgi:hypothetical protein
MFMIKYIFIAIVVVSSFSCATSYKKVDPSISTVYNLVSLDSVDYGFDENHFKAYGKKRYAKKAERKNLSMVAFKITNNQTDTLLPIRDLNFLHGGSIIKPLSSRQTQKEIKQPELIHFGWYLLALPFPAVIDAIGPFTQLPIALIAGNYNLFRAGAANRKLMENLQRDDIMYRQIPPGETSYGFICYPVKTTGDIAIEMKAKKK